jgi:tRNA(Ile)-lysidine synthase
MVLQTIYGHNMISPGDKVLAAVSGGADSVCMLHILNSIKKSLQFELCCAHVNHGLRGEAADCDERFVEEFCNKLQIPFYSKKFDVARYAEEHKQTTEEAGRNIRYTFFEELKKGYGFDKIATAHNKNDNAETILMRIIRGTGIDGLCGISYVREDGVIRPILDVARNQIEEYCRENNLQYCTDATNADNDYTRNKIRNQLIPYIEKEFNSGIVDSMVRLSKNAEEDSNFIKGYAERLFKRIGSPVPKLTPNALHIESFEMLDRSIAARIIRIAADKAAKGIRLEKKHIDGIFDLIQKPTGSSIDLPMGLKAEINYGWLVFIGEENQRSVAGEDDFFTQIALGETIYLDGIGKNISVREEDPKTYKCRLNEISADLDKIGNQPLFLRSRRDGDRMVWFLDGRTKKIKSIFIDQKIPKKDRNKIPLLATGSEIIAIVGSRVAENFKVTKDTERALVIEYGNVEKQQGID